MPHVLFLQRVVSVEVCTYQFIFHMFLFAVLFMTAFLYVFVCSRIIFQVLWCTCNDCLTCFVSFQLAFGPIPPPCLVCGLMLVAWCLLLVGCCFLVWAPVWDLASSFSEPFLFPKSTLGHPGRPQGPTRVPHGVPEIIAIPEPCLDSETRVRKPQAPIQKNRLPKPGRPDSKTSFTWIPKPAPRVKNQAPRPTEQDSRI